MGTRLFKRKVEVLTNGLTLNNKELDIEFDIPFDDDLAPNLSEVRIYNLSENTRNKLTTGKQLTINAGYVEDVGLVLSGSIESVRTTKAGNDKVTILKVLDSIPYDSEKIVELSFKKGIKADQIIKQLADKIGLKIAVLKLPTNKTFDKGHTVKGNALQEIQKVATDCGASAYISRSKAYIRKITEGDNNTFNLNVDTGLIDSPEYFEEEKNGKIIKGYKIKSLLQYRINTAAIIKLESIEAKVTLRVRKGKHQSSGDSYYTEMEAIL